MSSEHHTEPGTALLGGFLFLSLSMGFAPLAEAHVDAGDGVVTLHQNELVSTYQGFVSRISTAEGRAHGVRTPQLSQGALAAIPDKPRGCSGKGLLPMVTSQYKKVRNNNYLPGAVVTNTIPCTVPGNAGNSTRYTHTCTSSGAWSRRSSSSCSSYHGGGGG